MSGRGARLAVAVAVFAAVAACLDERPQQGCRMANEAVLARNGGPASAVAIGRFAPGRLLVAWSADEETWLSIIDEDGNPVGRVRRVERMATIGPDGAAEAEGAKKTFWPDDSGVSLDAQDLALAGSTEGVSYLAVLELPRSGRPGGAYVVAVGGDLVPAGIVRIGAAGPFANGISIARSGDGLLVAWHEGAPESSRVALASLSVEPLALRKSSTIDSEGAAASPSVAVSGDRGLVAWSQTVHGGETPGSVVKVAALDGRLAPRDPVVAASCRHLDPAPSLGTSEDGFVLVYRDDDDRDGRLEYYFVPLGGGGAPRAPAARISRADGSRGPVVAYGDPLFFGAVIRSFQHSLLVGLNRFDGRGVKQGGEFQIYADKSDFVRVALAAWGDQVLLAYAEDRRDRGRVLTGKVVCRDR